MKIAKLAAMANQIAAYFKSYPHEKAVAGIALHIEAFWTPGMRDTLRSHRLDHPGLDPLVVEAMSPKTEDMSRTAKQIISPGRVGVTGIVDAG